jgi:hypothetical protein
MRARLAAVLMCASCADPDVSSDFRAPTDDVVTRAPRVALHPEASPTSRMTKPVPLLPKRTLPLPPISGGTLRVTANGATVVAADPENDVVWLVDVESQAVSSVALQPGDEPGRVAEDAAGRIHVVLRSGGAVATMAVGTPPRLLQRRSVCAEPRGLAYRAADDALLIACADGQLLRLPAAGGDASLIKQLDDDLRDVVISGTDIIVSRFRSAQLLTLDAGGTVRTDALLPHVSASQTSPQSASSAVAWRMLALPSGGVLVAHQLELTTAVVTAPSQPAPANTPIWGGPVVEPDHLGPVTSTASTFGGANGETDVFLAGGLPVDIAVSSNGWFAAITAADGALTTSPLAAMSQAGPGAIATLPGTLSGFHERGQPVAVAFMPNQYTVVQLRAPAGIVIGIDDFIPFPAPDQSDVGHTLFHAQTPSALACASCHPEGRDDGHVWQFTAGEMRRTQNVSGGVLATAPLHWDGAFNDLSSLMDEVFVARMGGASPSVDQRVALASWLDSIPRAAPRPAQDALAVQRGQLLFESVDVGCTTCHSGPRFTNNLTLDVGTGRPFQVPSLTGLAARAPYLHDGCAGTLEERFTCGGGDAHGHTSQLTPQQLSDLVAYMKTL